MAVKRRKIKIKAGFKGFLLFVSSAALFLVVATSFTVYLKRETVNSSVRAASAACISVPVLAYRHVVPRKMAVDRGWEMNNTDVAVFENQMDYLIANGYVPITLDDFYRGMLKHSILPSRPVVVMVDVGYRDLYDYLYPIIKDRKININVALQPYFVEKEGFITWNQLRNMHDSGLVSLYNHSYDGSVYTLETEEELINDVHLATAKLIQHNLYFDGNYFVYPKGKVNQRVMDTLTREGYVMGFTMEFGVDHCLDRMMELPRILIGSKRLDMYGL